MKQHEIIVEQHDDGFVAYPLGIKGVVVGEGDTYEAAVADVESAIQFHYETFDLEMEQAANDPLFLADCEEVMEDFRFADADASINNF